MQKTTLAAFVVTLLLVALVLTGGVALAATINGDNGPNTLTGTPRADLIRGYGGNDNITGGKGWTASMRVRATITLAPQATVIGTW